MSIRLKEEEFAEAKARGLKTFVLTKKAFGTFVELQVGMMEMYAEKYGYKLVNLTTNPSTYFFRPCQQIVATFRLMDESREEESAESMKILKRRYAKGEITKEEYEEMKKTLEES